MDPNVENTKQIMFAKTCAFGKKFHEDLIADFEGEYGKYKEKWDALLFDAGQDSGFRKLFLYFWVFESAKYCTFELSFVFISCTDDEEKEEEEANCCVVL